MMLAQIFISLLLCNTPVTGQNSQLQSSVTVSPNQFPASRTCRARPFNAGDCEENRFATFTMTFVAGEGTTIPRGTKIKTAFAYKYNGIYRTETQYTRYWRWPQLQALDPTQPNYVTATVNTVHNNFDDVRVLIGNDGNPEITLAHQVSAGSKVSVTYGDTSGGGPGYSIPAIAYDIDLVVMCDPDGDGTYEVIAPEMPTISVVGTKLDRFAVVAPSTPESATFELIVTALQGEDKRLQNNYIVPSYTGTIEFSSTDPGAVLPPPYSFQPGDKGVKRFTVTLSCEGMHTVTVKDTESMTLGTSNPVFPGRTFDTGNKRLYWGVLQQHTSIGGHASQTPQYAYNYARNVSGLDFLTLTEHCTAGLDWNYNTLLADQYYEPHRFVTFGAIEWSSKFHGHRHLIYREAGQETGHCDCLYQTNPMIPCDTLLSSVLESVQGNDVLIIPHHMAWNFLGQQGVSDPELGDIDNPNQRLYEIYSTHGSSEKYDNAPYVIHDDPEKQWGPERKLYFQDAIALGYRFGVTAGTDNHMGQPGGHIGGPKNYARQGITAILSSNLTRDAIWEALWARRTYGTTGARIVLDFTVGGALMGSEVVSGDTPVVKVHATGTDTIRTVSVIRNGYETVYEHHPEAVTADITFVDTGVEEGNTYSYYARVVQKDQHMAWSSPVWVEFLPGKPFEIGSVYPNPFNPGLVVRLDMPEKTRVKAEIFTVAGKQVAILADTEFPAGVTELSWDGTTAKGAQAACGVYFVRLSSSYGVVVRKAVLVR
jgi:hypothetical protein